MLSSGAPSGRRRFTVTVSVVAVVLVCARLVLASRSGPRIEKQGVLYSVKDGNTLYTFDAAWRVETLREFDPGTGHYSVVKAPDSERTTGLRSRLLRELDLKGLDQVPAEGQSERAAMKGLGY